MPAPAAPGSGRVASQFGRAPEDGGEAIHRRVSTLTLIIRIATISQTRWPGQLRSPVGAPWKRHCDATPLTRATAKRLSHIGLRAYRWIICIIHHWEHDEAASLRFAIAPNCRWTELYCVSHCATGWRWSQVAVA